MFVRKKPNKSGKISVQIISKVNGANKVIKTIGCSDDHIKIDYLVKEGEDWIKTKRGIVELDFNNYTQELHDLLGGIESLTVIGVEKL